MKNASWNRIVFMMGWLPVILALPLLSSCSKLECRSTSECPHGTVCQNGFCVEPDFVPGTDPAPVDTATDSATDTESDSMVDTATTDTATTDTATDTATDTGTLPPGACRESWECNDDNICTMDACVDGECVYTKTLPAPPGCCSAASDCDDRDVCTLNACNAANWTCETTFVPGDGCCLENAHCDDGNDCTRDVCGPNRRCQYVVDDVSGGCCEDVYDCGASVCSDASCVNHFCQYTLVDPLPSGCCVDVSDCAADGNPCTRAECDGQSRCRQVVDATLGDLCCATSSDCEDWNSCTTGTCTFNRTCAYSPVQMAGCCSTIVHCEDGNSCTAEVCENFTCGYVSPDPRPTGCCAEDSHCGDFNDCTRDLCVSGRCQYVADHTLGPQCCTETSHCEGVQACATGVCDNWDHHCYEMPPTAPLSEGCCLSGADCVHGMEPDCNVGVCGLSTAWTCRYSGIDDGSGGSSCENDVYCDGEQSCVIMGGVGVCVTQPGTIPCGGDANPCRERVCDELARTCALFVEHDTDVTCDDGVFCNGVDVCSAGDCVHQDPPCMDDEGLPDCVGLFCDETGRACVEADLPQGSPCTSEDACEGISYCYEDVVSGDMQCVSGGVCGDGDDCNYYTCTVDPLSGAPICESHHAPDGTPCDIAYSGTCFGMENRYCLAGTCSIGTDPMCDISGGFDKRYRCIYALGSPDGCIEDQVNFEYLTVSCSELGGETAEISFSTALEHNKVSAYGATCGDGFLGGDYVVKVDMRAGDTVDVTLLDERTTNGAHASILMLLNGSNPASCVSVTPSTGMASYTAVSDAAIYVVVDMDEHAFVDGILEIDCN